MRWSRPATPVGRQFIWLQRMARGSCRSCKARRLMRDRAAGDAAAAAAGLASVGWNGLKTDGAFITFRVVVSMPSPRPASAEAERLPLPATPEPPAAEEAAD